MIKINTVILGGGISGVSFSQKLTKENIENIVIEKEQIGGCIYSAKYNDLWFEMGAHTIYNSYSDTIEFIKKNKIQQDIATRKKLPFLMVMPTNQIQSIFSNLNYLTLVPSYIFNRKISKDDKTVKQYASQVFGKKNYDNTFKYCFSAVLSQDSDNFPMKYLFKKYDRDTSFPRNFTFKDGLSNLFKNTSVNLVKGEVFKISQTDDKQWLIMTNNATYNAKNICLATPWNITKNLIYEILPSIASHQYSPKMSHLTSIGIVVSKDKLKHIKDIAGLIGKEQFFYSAVSRDVIKHPNLRAIVFHCKSQPNLEMKNIRNKATGVLGISTKDIIHAHTKQNSLPCYNKNHDIFIKDLEDALTKHKNLFITGNFFDRLAIENCIRRSNHQASKLICNKNT